MLRDSSFGDDYEKEIGASLGEKRRRQEEADDLKKELNLYRSGSAPPTVNCSFSAAAGGLFSGGGGFGCDDEEFRRFFVVFVQGPVKMMADDLDAEEATHVPGNDNVGEKLWLVVGVVHYIVQIHSCFWVY
ncbi:unnamed protein product [Brassica napus]|uniref:(rape) hypothetical protein n=1 Tax=Brassica napus TaxID=3708 RepID=A0A816UQ23_BRANA|nr:unnamed protein product [Brassica napus]